jgi:hypothetical protein
MRQWTPKNENAEKNPIRQSAEQAPVVVPLLRQASGAAILPHMT